MSSLRSRPSRSPSPAVRTASGRIVRWRLPRGRPAARTRSCSVRPVTRSCSTPRSPATARRSGCPSRSSMAWCKTKEGSAEIEPALATKWESSSDGTDWTFTLRAGRQVPRRHRLQRRRGLLQLRPLVQLHRRCCRARTSRRTGRTSSAASPRTRAADLRQQPLQVLHGEGPETAGHHDRPARPASSRRRWRCRRSRSQSPDGAEEVRRGQGRAAPLTPSPTRRTRRTTRPAPARTSSPSRDRGQRRPSPSSATTTTGATRPRSTRSSSRSSRTRTPASRRCRPAQIDGYDLVAPGDIKPLKDGGLQGPRPRRRSTSSTSASTRQEPGAGQARRSARRSRTRSTARRIVEVQVPDGAQGRQGVHAAGRVAGYADDVTTYDYDLDKAKQLLAAGRRDEPDAEVLLADRGQPAVHAGPEGHLRGDQGRPAEGRHQDRAGGAQVEPGLPERRADRQGRPAPARAGPATTTTPTTSSARSSAGRRPEFGLQQPGRSSTRSPRPTPTPDPAKRTDAYKAVNRQIMEFLPAVPISHSPPSVAKDVTVSVPAR